MGSRRPVLFPRQLPGHLNLLLPVCTGSTWKLQAFTTWKLQVATEADSCSHNFSVLNLL